MRKLWGGVHVIIISGASLNEFDFECCAKASPSVGGIGIGFSDGVAWHGIATYGDHKPETKPQISPYVVADPQSSNSHGESLSTSV